jgi:hypothetical protein
MANFSVGKLPPARIIGTSNLVHTEETVTKAKKTRFSGNKEQIQFNSFCEARSRRD